jgi:hypothetical protein
MNIKSCDRMKPTKFLLFSFLIASLTNCGDSSTTTEQISKDYQTPIAQTDKPEKKELKKFSKEDVARFAISTIMQQPSKTIKVRFQNGLYYISYKKKSDSKKFEYKIKIDDWKIVWANIDGRWRDGEYDEKISFEENDNKLKITQTFSDGSIETKEFKNGE